MKNKKRKNSFFFDGRYYDTEEELLVAEMLTNMGINFFHHIVFEFFANKGDSQPVIWCPDFVLEAPFRWVGKICNGSVIVGLEVKKSHIKGKPRSKSKRLLQTLGIPILLIARANVVPYYEKDMRLPLKTLKK